MSLIVQKFGGSSVADAHHLYNVAKIITKMHAQNNDVVVVVSAQGSTTDNLLKKAHEINETPSKREMDALLSAGEQMSSSLLAMAIENLGFPVISLTGWQAGFKTDNNHGNAQIKNIVTDRIKEEIKNKNIVILAGFQGFDEKNDITTLGRGGSDTSAIAVAAALSADKCKIYTDVDGVYTSDPRIVPSAKKIKTISYDEMYELSRRGAKVMNDRSILTAQKHNVTIEVLSSMLSKNDGTTITDVATKLNACSGIAITNNIVKLTLTCAKSKENLIGKLTETLKSNGIMVDTSLKVVGNRDADSFVFTIPENELQEAMNFINKLVPFSGDSQVFYEKSKSNISVINISENININIASIIFEILSEAKIDIEMVACDDKRVSILLPTSNMSDAVNIIHSKLFEEDTLV